MQPIDSLKVGFYLFNIGWALLILPIKQTLEKTQEAVEVLSFKVGGFAIFLGVMLFLNLFMFFRGKKVSKNRREAAQRQKTRKVITPRTPNGPTGPAPAMQ